MSGAGKRVGSGKGNESAGDEPADQAFAERDGAKRVPTHGIDIRFAGFPGLI
jgi:hypothetical protein